MMGSYKHEFGLPQDFPPHDKIISGEIWNIYMKMLSTLKC